MAAENMAADMPPATERPWASAHDLACAGRYEQREADWRNGAIVYQVLVDRFAPSANLAAKRHLYPAPKRLRRWDELPRAGRYLPELRLWSHEIDFWGGDLASLRSRLDHVQTLGADVLYLNPIHAAYTNHKYDALDFFSVSPEFGQRADVIALADDLHQRGMKLVLDGVFNHMGRNSPVFQSALAQYQAERSGQPLPADAPRHRDWFHFDEQLPGSARAWATAENLPELHLEHPEVREWVYAGADSVVRSYLRDGVDGWRLDVAHDIGFAILDDLTRHAHAEKPGSLVVGELWTYPQQWFPSVDGVMNMALREIIVRMACHRIPPATAARMMARLIEDAGVDNLLKSWLLLDNHDTPRLATLLPDVAQRRMAQLLQFTLPGSPNLYYGSELGMTGGDDPQMRAPMCWQALDDDNPDWRWTRQLIALRRQHRALRIGDFRLLVADRLLAFERYTDRIEDAVLVFVNPGLAPVQESVLVPDSKLMSAAPLRNLLAPERGHPPAMAAMIDVELPPGGLLLLQPHTQPVQGYTTYKRVQ